tara:strand:- start:491 stop:1588 length:1098 start_codon:yes stop_codon:yes gene_type:complete
MHLFLPQQPDFNWRNSLLVSEFDQILRFWLDRGVDGFRVDVAGALIKDRYLRSNPQIGPWDLNAGRFEQWLAFEHIYDVFQPESHDIFRRWRKIVDEYDAYLFGETYTFDPLELARLLPGDGMHGGFWFEPMHIEWSAQEIHRALSAPIDLLKDRLLWAAGSHDMPRSPTRFGGGDLGRERSFALNILLAFLPGVLVLYQGEELGLVDGRVPLEAALDPVDSGRDGCRTPMPWSVGKGNGFTTGNAWLRSDSRSDYETAQVQLTDPDSWHACYKALLTVRKSLPSLEGFSVVWTELEDSSVISYERGPVGVAINTSTDPNCINVPPDVEIVYSTLGTVKDHATRVTLGSHGGVIWLKASGKSNSI